MAQATMNIRMDADLKKQFEAFCSEIGMTMTTKAVCVFAKMAVKERRIPFEIKADPIRFIRKRICEFFVSVSAIRSGKAKLKEHELIEADE